ncbi:MAG: hypothetical protein AAF385_01010 [Pseudomonadota bacterium]
MKSAVKRPARRARTAVWSILCAIALLQFMNFEQESSQFAGDLGDYCSTCFEADATASAPKSSTAAPQIPYFGADPIDYQRSSPVSNQRRSSIRCNTPKESAFPSV